MTKNIPGNWNIFIGAKRAKKRNLETKQNKKRNDEKFVHIFCHYEIFSTFMNTFT